MPGQGQVGLLCKLYYNSAATHTTPTWVEIKDAQDVAVTLQKDKADVSARSGKFKKQMGAHIDAAIAFGYLHNVGADTVFDALLASFISNTAIELAAMDQAIATPGAQGLRAYCEVFGLDQGQAMADGVKYDVEANPTRRTESGVIIEPDWYDVP